MDRIRAHNVKLAEIFDNMAREFRNDRYRHRAYQYAAAAIRTHDKLITSGTQARNEIRGIGKSISDKIDEIVTTGKLKFLEELPQSRNDTYEVIKQFENIYGVGPVTAQKWFNEGYRSLSDLARLYNNMTSSQKLGYYYYHQLKERIPRAEMEQLHQAIDHLWKPMGVIYVIAGSYRRGEPDSGDIDILIQRSSDVDINTLIAPLIRHQLIIGNLAVGPTKYMGIIRLAENTNARRIDMRLVDSVSWPYALLYFTGSKQLNIDMRTKARTMDLSMNEYGMVNKEGVQYPAKTEKDIFDFLDIKYLPPTERSIEERMETNRTDTGEIEIGEGGTGEIEIGEGGTGEIETNIGEGGTGEIETNIGEGGTGEIEIGEGGTGGKWYRPTESLLLYTSNGIESTGNIAAFDLDWTLVRPFQSQWPKSSDDIKLLPNIPATLKHLRANGYTIVIFTNQKSTTENKVNLNFQRVNNFIHMILDIPLILMMSLREDIYRKPNIGMYQTLQQMVPPITSAFYCGDAAGRPQDFSDSDRVFAQNAGISFYIPEQIIPLIERLKPLPQIAVANIELPSSPVMVLFVGMPGSGKTTYYHHTLAPLGYIHANQDTVGTGGKSGTKAQLLRFTRNTMATKNNICIDATNPGQARRQEFYNLAAQNGYNVAVIHFVGDGRGLNKLRHKPVPTIAYSMYYKYLSEPTTVDTPGVLYQIYSLVSLKQKN